MSDTVLSTEILSQTEAGAVTGPEREVRRLIDSWATAIRSRNIDALMSHYAPDAVLFDAIAPLQVDASAFRRNWEQFFEYFPGPVGYELRGLKVTADGGAGFSSSLARLAGTDREGKEQGGWMRQTVGYRKIDGAWRITHEHWSAPIDMETGKAQHDLTPE